MAEYPYDVIPPGKKAVIDPATGEWTLVDLDKTDPKDLLEKYESLQAKYVELEAENQELKEQVKVLEGSSPKKPVRK
jgi:hypothetical protein